MPEAADGLADLALVEVRGGGVDEAVPDSRNASATDAAVCPAASGTRRRPSAGISTPLLRVTFGVGAFMAFPFLWLSAWSRQASQRRYERSVEVGGGDTAVDQEVAAGDEGAVRSEEKGGGERWDRPVRR